MLNMKRLTQYNTSQPYNTKCQTQGQFTKEEHEALKKLKTDTLIVTVPAKKGKASVIDHEDNVSK